jgi:hypothetical protein
MYPKGMNSAVGIGMKGAGGKLLGAAKGLSAEQHNAAMAALVAAAPEVAAKYGLLEKGKK